MLSSYTFHITGNTDLKKKIKKTNVTEKLRNFNFDIRYLKLYVQSTHVCVWPLGPFNLFKIPKQIVMFYKNIAISATRLKNDNFDRSRKRPFKLEAVFFFFCKTVRLHPAVFMIVWCCTIFNYHGRKQHSVLATITSFVFCARFFAGFSRVS